MNKVLLDTNAYSYFTNGNQTVINFLNGVDHICFSVIVLGELYIGFKNGNREKHNKDILKQFLDETAVSLYEVTAETADIYKDIYLDLKKNGTPIPINDIWIAAQAVELGAKLLTFDKHFSNIPGLRIEHLAV